MDPSSLLERVAAARAFSPETSALRLSEVTLLAAGCERLPEASTWWPVRALAASSAELLNLKNSYLCGRVDDVLQVLGGLQEAPLAILVDEAPGERNTFLHDGLEVQVVSGLQKNGFADIRAWEAVVSAICARHPATIQSMILDRARATPNKVALIFEDREWTFREVVSMACSVSDALHARGIMPSGGTLAVRAHCSDRLVILYLGLYSARYLFQLIDSRPASLSHRLEVCHCQALLCERVTTPAVGIQTVFIEDLQLDPDRPIDQLSVQGELSDPLFIEYTSGSTGRPKSVLAYNWRMAHWVQWRQFHFPLIPGDEREGRNLFFIWYWHITLCQGGTTVVYPVNLNHDVSALMQYARRHSISRFDCLTPGLLLALLEVEDSLPESLKVMISGGEALPTSTCREWLRRWPHCTLLNNMATTETSADVCFCRITPAVVEMDVLYAPISDGCIVWQNELKIIDEQLVMQGWNVGEGYLPPTTSKSYVASCCGRQNQYWTGDRAKWSDGFLIILGRVDSVVKIRGHRVDLSGLEAVLAGCKHVKDVACVAWRDTICSLVVADSMQDVQKFAKDESSEAHLIVWYEAAVLPYTASGKRDRKRAQSMLEEASADFRLWAGGKVAGTNGHSLLGGPPATEQEHLVAAAWKEVLNRDVGREEPFQQAGGHSLLAMKLAKILKLQPAEIFAFPTIAQMAERMTRTKKSSTITHGLTPQAAEGDVRARIAVIGMAGRFPGALSVSALWRALEAGADLLSDLAASPQHVPRKGVVPDLGFDCKFWGIPPESAKIMDTTQRALLETAYEALEDVGLDPFRVAGRVGVVVSGGSISHYASETLGVDLDELRTEKPDEYFAFEIGTDKDYLATQIAYRLNLHGPAEVVQTACSSSLVAVVRAVQLLRLHVCDYVICGGGSFSPDAPVRKVDGMIWSPDGICRPFADGANGTVASDGCGLVVLTRLDDALRKGEHIYASILGAATNNDGSRKAGFSAPSFEGQVEVLQAAHYDAGINSHDVDYIEAHGTGTKLGDPLEAQALTEVLDTERTILLGSVKGNIGHLNTAAGIPGFIKATLMLHHQRMVPSLHADSPNTFIDWQKTPLRLAERANDWQGKVVGVSSFGVGGTNAHVVLGAVASRVVKPPRSVHMFTASGKTVDALQDLCSHLRHATSAEHAARTEATLLARPRFEHRAFALRSTDLPAAAKISSRRPVVLLFPGQGGAYADMGAALEKEGLVACGCKGLAPIDIVKASLAIASSLEKQGLVVEAVLGHSVGEWSAAAFAGAVSLENCVKLAELRGHLMATMSTGMMISARAPLPQVEDLAKDGVEIACINGAETVVLAGPREAMSGCVSELQSRGITTKQLRTEHAFHTAAVDSILPAYTEALQTVQYSSTRLPVLSNVSGDWYGHEPTSAQYWAKHLRETVRFHDNLKQLAKRFPAAVIVEVGPSVLAGVVAREATRLGVDWHVVPTMRERDEVEAYMNCLGTLWTHSDLQPDLPLGGPKMELLPTYPFQRQLIAKKTASAKAADRKSQSMKTVNLKVEGDATANFFYDCNHERVEISCRQIKEAAVVLDGNSLPEGMPQCVVQAAYDRAAIAARASGCVIFVGTNDLLPTINDTSQELLIKNVVSLIGTLAKTKVQLEIFFVLKANLRYAALWGLLRSVARELPELRLRRLQYEDGSQLVFPALPGEYLIKADGVYVPRLRMNPMSRSLEVPSAYTRALVTGGLRGLGVKVAEWLLCSGRASALVLMGRNPPKGDAAEVVQRLQSKGQVEVCIGDVSEWNDVQNLPECDLVVHVAGSVKDGLLLLASDSDIQRVLRPKIRGAVHLKKQFPNARFLGFSSTSCIFGTAGQATYAAANAFVDAIMPTIQWGGWGEVGMAADLNIAPVAGERFLPVSAGLECLERVLDKPRRQAPPIVLDVDWDAYRHFKDAFSPEDPLLADMEAQPRPLSVLGEPLVEIDNVARSWELFLGPDGSRFRGSCQAWDVCQQHVVGQTPIFPGTAFVALALEVAKEAGIPQALLTNIVFLRPLELAAPRRLTSALVHHSDGSAGGFIRFSSQPVQIDTEGKQEQASVILHCTCTLSSASKQRPQAMSVAAETTIDDLYARFADVGFHYGPSFQASRVEMAKDKPAARCQFINQPTAFFQVHPAALDTSMHLMALLHPSGLNGVPHRVQRLQVSTGTNPVEARACIDGMDAELQLIDNRGDVVCSIKGLELAPLDAPPKLQLRQRTWRSEAANQFRGTWLLHGQEVAKLSLPQVTANKSDTHDATVFAVKAETLQDVKQCAECARALSAQGPCWVIALEARFAEAAAAAAAEVGAQAVVGNEKNVQRLAASLGLKAPVVHVGDDGLLVEELREVQPPPAVIAGPSDAFTVTVDPSQGAKGAKCIWSHRRVPEAHEVELKTSVWALNFRDVLVAVGAIPSEVAGQSLGIGGECYGEVVQVGKGVTGLNVGDHVIAVPPDGMGTFATIDARWVGLAPPTMTPNEAVAGTAVYATAWLGLHWMARITSGDKVLIHSAAGGVGLAAMGLCLRAGCTVYATASTPEKRALLLSRGAAGAFDSRNPTAFDEGIRLATDGEGVDVVLNSLSGEAIATSMRLLKPFGRFIEIGKRDQYEDTKMGLAPFLNGLTFATAHLDVLMLKQPERCRKLLNEVWSALPELPTLPTTNFNISELDKALEYFSKGVHVGKVLVSIGAETSVHAVYPSMVFGPDGDATTQAIREKMTAKEGSGGVVCIPRLEGLTDEKVLVGAQVVVTASRAVAAFATALDPHVLCVELPRWEPIASLHDWLGLRGSFVATEEEKGGNLHEWLMEVIEEMAGSIGMEQTFESVGLDSLALISLARRLTSKVGKSVSVVDLYDHPTPQQLLDALSGGPQGQLMRPKVVCLHGFRTNKEIMSLACAPLVSAVGSVEWIFINSPRRASGPTDPNIPSDMETFEWWGEKNGCYETGWMAPHFDGIEQTLPMVTSMAPSGIVGFSQGAAAAAILDCSWLALFSAVVPPGLKQRSTPSFHGYDPAEDFSSQCIEVASNFLDKEVFTHSRNHTIPQDDSFVKAFASFVATQMAKQ